MRDITVLQQEERLPDDLVPLPYYPWNERPASFPIDREEIRTALRLTDGNVSQAARMLRCSAQRIRTFIKNSPYLQREQEEAREAMQDRAEEVLSDAMGDQTLAFADPARADAAARFVLRSLGKRRGYAENPGQVNISAQGDIVIQWADGSGITGHDDGPPGKVVDITETAVIVEGEAK